MFFYQLEQFVELSEIIAPILLKYAKASTTVLTAQQLEFIKDLIKLLRPLEVITKEISREDYVTASKIIPIVSCLTGTYNTMKTSTDIEAKPRTLIIDGLKKRFRNIQQVYLLAAATILDPNNSEEFDAIEGSDFERKIWDFHKLLVKEQLSTCNTLALESQGLNEKFKHYLSQAVVHLKYDSILYWQEQKNSNYHHVHSIAVMYMSIVRSSVPRERLFSIAGNIASDEQNRLDSSRLDKLLFLKSLDMKHWKL